MKVIPCILGAACALVLSTSSVEAQKRCVAPSVGANGTASTSTSYPWNRRGSSIRVQYIYDSTEVPHGGNVLVIQRIKFRPADTTATTSTWIGGTYGGVEIKMSHAAVAFDKMTTTFASNHGKDMTTVFKGSVDLMPGRGTGSGVPSRPYVDITLDKPFLYNPKTGPLLVDMASDGSKWTPNSGTGTLTLTCATTFTTDLKKATRMFNLTSHTATTGSVQASVGLVMEIECTDGSVVVVGRGCSDGLNNVGRHFTNQLPTVGNAKFNLEGDSLPPGAQALMIIGVNKRFQSVDLTGAGAAGCFLHADSVAGLGLKTATGMGMAAFGDGSIDLAAAIPNNSALKGAYVRTQILTVDANSKRALKVVFTNGLEITIQ